MIIKKLTATFGKLSGETLELNKGLNIIEAPNESGKTTWCAFVRAMLYGIDSSEREKGGNLPDKKKYLPWNGNAMEGAAEIELNGRDILIQRTGTSKYPMQELTAVDVMTGEKLTGLTGETMTGVPLRVFESSAFIGRTGMRVSNTPELEKMIAGIVSSGEENVSFSESIATLKTWQKKRSSRQSGAVIPTLEARISELKTRLIGISELTERSSSLADSVKKAFERRSNARKMLGDAK